MVQPLPIVALLIALAACGTADPAAPRGVTAPASAPATTLTGTQPSTTTTTTLWEGPTVPRTDVPPTTAGDSLVDLAIADLRAMIGDAGDIIVISQDEVVWPDGALGCPTPGMSYTQALVDGSRIILGHDGVEYAYHSGRAGTPFYCPPKRQPDSDR